MASNTEFEETETIQYEYIKYANGDKKFLGSGSFGRVYAAVDTRRQAKIAVKEVEEIDNKNVMKLHEEIKLHSNLKHENITKYLDSVSENGIFKILMEYVPGGSLYTLIMTEWGSLENDECTVSCFSKQILEGLKYLHNRRIVHRDIKGENVLVDTNNWVLKITDFGISKQLATINPRARTSTGSYRYMAPEVINVEGRGYETRADIWSFGCTMVVMVTGNHPFPEFDSEYAVLYKVGHGKIHPVFPESISEDAKTFLLKCFEPDPDKRATAEQLLEHPFIKKRCVEPDPDKRATAEQLLEHPFIKKQCFEPDTDKRATAEQLLEIPFPKKRKRVNVAGTRLDTSGTIGASASMSVLDGGHDTRQRTSLNNENVVEDSPNVNARKTLCSNLKHQVGQIGINHANSSAQRNYLKNQTEDGRRENISYIPFLSKEIASRDIHTSGFTGIKVTYRGHQDPLSQPVYVSNASMPYGVNDMSVSQARPENVPFQNFSARPVPRHGSLFGMIDIDKTKDLHVIPISYSGNSASQPTRNFQPAPNLMSRNINPTMAMQTNVLFSNNCSFSQNQSSTFHGRSYQNMSAIKCSEYNIRVDDDHCDPTIQGLSVTGDGRIILVDQENERVKMLSHNREKISFLDGYESVYDVTVYNDTTAVVTGDYQLFFIGISGSELRISKSIETTFNPYGIQTCNKNFLVTCWDCDAVKLITENGEVMWSVSEDRGGRPLFSCPKYITCFQDGNQCRVVVSDCYKDTLTVLDGDSGEVIKVCEVKGKGTSGVTTDNIGNIYVCYNDTCEIAIWDKDMTNSRILTNTNGRPLALGFDASRNQLIVSYWFKDYVEIFFVVVWFQLK